MPQKDASMSNLLMNKFGRNGNKRLPIVFVFIKLIVNLEVVCFLQTLVIETNSVTSSLLNELFYDNSLRYYKDWGISTVRNKTLKQNSDYAFLQSCIFYSRRFIEQAVSAIEIPLLNIFSQLNQ